MRRLGRLGARACFHSRIQTTPQTQFYLRILLEVDTCHFNKCERLHTTGQGERGGSGKLMDARRRERD